MRVFSLYAGIGLVLLSIATAMFALMRRHRERARASAPWGDDPLVGW